MGSMQNSKFEMQNDGMFIVRMMSFVYRTSSIVQLRITNCVDNPLRNILSKSIGF